MKKTLAATLAGASLAIAGVQLSSLLAKTSAGTQLRLVHATVDYTSLDDGGFTASLRACAYENRATDAGLVRVGEPCWGGPVDGVVAAELAKAALKVK